jgi:hypothetical protein
MRNQPGGVSARAAAPNSMNSATIRFMAAM